MNNIIDVTQFEDVDVADVPSFQVRTVASTAPVTWFKKGVADLKKAPMVSMSYGLIYVAIGIMTILFAWTNPLYVASMVAAFLLLGPIIAVGFYCMSRSLERGEEPSFSQGLDAFRFNSSSLIGFALVLVFIVAAWAVIAGVLIALFFNSITVSDDIVTTILSNEQMLPFALTYLVIALIFSIVTFSISVISVPLITNRRTDVVTAMSTSIKAVRKNPLVMLSWALMVSSLIIVGAYFFYIGLAITLPIVGHASWHAYRDLVIDE